MTALRRFIGIDYSGAGRPTASNAGLRVFEARDGAHEVLLGVIGAIGVTGRQRWNRRELATWLRDSLGQPGAPPAIIAIDHALGFPAQYVGQYADHHGLAHDWRTLLEDFCTHWPADEHTVESLRADNPRSGNARWRRICDERYGGKSIFHFDVPGSVAKSTIAGLPWVLRLIQQVPNLHVWPFDGWVPPAGAHVLAEGYPALVSKLFPREPAHTQDQHDAKCLALWLQQAQQSGALARAFQPDLEAQIKRKAETVEGWILTDPSVTS